MIFSMPATACALSASRRCFQTVRINLLYNLSNSIALTPSVFSSSFSCNSATLALSSVSAGVRDEMSLADFANSDFRNSEAAEAVKGEEVEVGTNAELEPEGADNAGADSAGADKAALAVNVESSCSDFLADPRSKDFGFFQPSSSDESTSFRFSCIWACC